MLFIVFSKKKETNLVLILLKTGPLGVETTNGLDDSHIQFVCYFKIINMSYCVKIEINC